MTQPAAADSDAWQRRWTIDAGPVTLQPRGDWLHRLATVPGICRVTAVTGAENIASRRLLERQRFQLAGALPGSGEMRYTLSLG